MSGSRWTCTTLPTCTSTAVVGVNGDFPPITVTGNFASIVTGTLTNLVTVSGGGETSTTDDTATDPAAFTPDLTVSKSHAGSFTAGQAGAAYTVTPHKLWVLVPLQGHLDFCRNASDGVHDYSRQVSRLWRWREADLDEQRVLNSLAVLSVGARICPNLDLVGCWPTGSGPINHRIHVRRCAGHQPT
jgi:hypothetical protein